MGDMLDPIEILRARRASAERVLKRVQRIGGQAVVGCFQTVGTAVAEAEANLPTIEERHKRKALKMWIDLRSIPGTHPLALIARRPACKRFVSPMQKIAEYGQGAPLDDLEATQPYISAPWDARPDTVDGTDDGLRSAARAQETHGIRIATSASVRNQLVGIGGAIESIDRIRNHTARHEYDKTLGTIGQSDAYTAALASIEAGLGFVVGAVYAGTLSARVHGHTVRVFTNNRTILITLRASPKRTRQWIIGGILKHVEFLKGFAIRVVFAWAPVSSIFELGQRAKQLAQRSTDEGRVASDRPRLTKRIVLKAQQRLAQATAQMPTTFGEAVRRIDAAWPGNHTRRMYDELSKRQASVLSQLRTGMTPVNMYLHNIKAVETNFCECGEAVESREHFIFHCVRWSEQRQILGIWTGDEDLPRLLGGSVSTDIDDWTPDMDAVRAVIHFTLATKRFERDISARGRTTM